MNFGTAVLILTTAEEGTVIRSTATKAQVLVGNRLTWHNLEDLDHVQDLP